MPEAPAATTPAPASRRRRRVAALVVALVGGSLLVAGNAYVLSSTSGAIVAADLAPERPAALVLGNYVSSAGVPCVDLRERLETALALYETKRVQRLIVSGLARPGYDEPHPMRDWLVARGVLPADVVVDVNGHRTAASMASAVALGFRSLLVVSQDYHLPRALYFARRAGIDAVGVTAPLRRGSIGARARIAVREALARPEAVLEVALRGVRI